MSNVAGILIVAGLLLTIIAAIPGFAMFLSGLALLRWADR